jgi:large subunit ribosomal protein L30
MNEKRSASRSRRSGPDSKAPAGRSTSSPTGRAKSRSVRKTDERPAKEADARVERPTSSRGKEDGAERRKTARPARAQAATVDMLRIKLVRSPIGSMQRHKHTVRTLGLRRLNQVVERPDSPQLRGMIFAVKHLVQVVE